MTACGSASLIYIVPYFRRTLGSLRHLTLPEDDREQGVGGLLLFFCGIIDEPIAKPSSSVTVRYS